MKSGVRNIWIKVLIVLGFAVAFAAAIEVLSLNPKTAPVIEKLTNSEEYRENGSGYEEVGEVIRGVRSDDGATVLVLGDSIARQYFKGKSVDDTVSVQCASAAISVTGQYMMAMEWLNTHPEAREIYLYMHPTSLARDIDTEWGYPYVVIPFGLYDMMHYLDEETVREMKSVYGGVFMEKTIIRLINDSALNRKLYLNYLKNNRESYVQQNEFEISEQYLIRLKEECENRNVALHLVNTPSPEYQKTTVETLQEDYMKTKLAAAFPEYYGGISYFSDEYTNDYVHLSEEYTTREFMDEVWKEIRMP